MFTVPALASISEVVKRAAADAGFDLAGVAAVRNFPELDYFSEWIESGYAGEMDYLAGRDGEGRLKRGSLAHAAPWARSVVVCAVNYNSAQPYSTDAADPRCGWISRYAWSERDYHDVVLEKLRQVEAQLHTTAECRIWCYVDTGPLVERVYAKYAGIGWIGKNACIINQQLGSWLFLGVILTSLELEPDMPAPDRCGSCTRCIDACPTEAFIAPGKLDATRCISYLTIEKRGVIPEELRDGIGRQIFGCDICQDVCPWNRKSPAAAASQLQPRPELVNPALDWLAAMDEHQFRGTFRGSPVKRSKYSGLRRNVAIAMGNSADERFREQLARMAEDDDPLVAEHARWALKRLETTLTAPGSAD